MTITRSTFLWASTIGSIMMILYPLQQLQHVHVQALTPSSFVSLFHTRRTTSGFSSPLQFTQNFKQGQNQIKEQNQNYSQGRLYRTSLNSSSSGRAIHNHQHTSSKESSPSASHSTGTASHSSPPMTKSAKLTIGTILIATTLNLLGFTLTSPLNPTLGQHFNLPTGASFGSLTSAYPAGMLLGLFTWPKLSDSLGRKKIIIVSLLGSGLGLGLQSYVVGSGGGLGIFLASRVFTGIFSGSAPVAKAFLADMGDAHEEDYKKDSERDSDDNDKNGHTQGDQQELGLVAKYLGWRDAASTLSYILGPALGGILFDTVRCWGCAPVSVNVNVYSSMRWLNQGKAATTATTAINSLDGRAKALAFVIGVSALGSLIASFMVMTLVKESNKSVDNKQDNAGGNATVNMNSMNTNGESQSQSKKIKVEETEKQTQKYLQMEEQAKKELAIISCPLGQSLWTGIATVCVISFLYHIADSTFFAFYPALLQSQMGFSAKEIGMSFTGFACISFLCGATSLSSKLIQKFGVVNACALGLSTVGAGLLGLSVSASSHVSVGVMKFLMFGAAGLYFGGVPLYGPTIPTMLLLCVPPNQRGAVLGLDGVINTMGRIVSPLIMGDLYRRYGATAAFGTASAAVFLSSSIALLRRFIVARSQRRLAE